MITNHIRGSKVVVLKVQVAFNRYKSGMLDIDSKADLLLGLNYTL